MLVVTILLPEGQAIALAATLASDKARKPQLQPPSIKGGGVRTDLLWVCWTFIFHSDLMQNMLQQLKQHRITRHLAGSLVGLLFLQLLLPLQAHSRIVQDSHGLTVVMCTLNGPKNVQIDLGEPSAYQPHASAAMVFSDLLNNLSPLVFALQPPRQILSWSTVQVAEALPLHGSEQLSPNSRAPPQA